MKEIYRSDPDGDPDYDGEEFSYREYIEEEEAKREMELISDSYTW